MTTYRQILAIREFRVLFTATSATVIAKMMETLGLAALVYAKTGSPLLAAVAYLGGFLPQALGAMTLLSVADRLRPRTALATWSAVHATALVLMATGVLPLWAMLALLMILGFGDPVAGAISNALVVDVLPEEAYVLGRSLLNVGIGSMQIVGYAVGGIVLALVSPIGALWTAAGVGFAASLVFRLRLQDREPRATGRASLAATWAGNRTLFSSSSIRRLLLALWLPASLIVGVESMFVPYGGKAAGALLTAAAVGMLIGDLTIGRWTSPETRTRLTMPLFLLLACPYLVFVLHPNLAVATGIAFVASFGYAGILSLQERFVSLVPKPMLGQAMGVVGSGQSTMQALCAIMVGGLAQVTEPATAIATTALVTVVVTLALLAKPWPKTSGEQLSGGSPSDPPNAAEPEASSREG
ncbi:MULTISPECIES: MFS transporter [Actinoplanes]|uniref:MFS transporter n=1 Tax=Actinoplanes TaxID=1865 RepID=UPI0007C755C5|nr:MULTISPECIES: MFS transporter [Actinoplanes]GLY02711.1 membrane protein [Actinoplanes sp. NBRC 101535]